MASVDKCALEDEPEMGANIEFEDLELSPAEVERRKLAKEAFRSHAPILSRAFSGLFAAYDGPECVAISRYPTKTRTIAARRRRCRWQAITVFQIEASPMECEAGKPRDAMASTVKTLTDEELHDPRMDLYRREPFERLLDLFSARRRQRF